MLFVVDRDNQIDELGNTLADIRARAEASINKGIALNTDGRVGVRLLPNEADQTGSTERAQNSDQRRHLVSLASASVSFVFI